MPAAPDDPWTRFVLAVLRLNGQITEIGESLVRPIGQSSARWHVLGSVSVQPMTVADMARSMGRARQSVQEVTDALRREGLVRAEPHPADRRTRLIMPTAAGMQVMEAIYRRQVTWSDRVVPALDPSRLHRLATALNEVADDLDTATLEG